MKIEFKLRYTNGLWLEVTQDMYNKDAGIFAKVSNHHIDGLSIYLGEYPEDEHDFIWTVDFNLQVDRCAYGVHDIGYGEHTEDYIMQQITALLPSLINFLYDKNVTSYRV